MTTMADVARRAGVSLSTVSHVVNRTRPVSQETMLLVNEAIAELGFVPNAVARSLARASTNAIGIAISIGTNHYFNDIVSSIEQACARIGQFVFLSETRNEPDGELKVVREFVQRRVDGVILAPSSDPENRAVEFLRANGMPFVLVDRLTHAEVDGVGLQNQRAMGMLVDHLVSHGHRRIGLVPGEPGLKTTIERGEGYALALRGHDIPVDPALIHEGNATSEQARRATHRVLDLPEPPTAIASGNNLATIGVMKAIKERRLDVPRDLAFIGFDDFEWADCFEPSLSVIAQPNEAIGRRAAELLLERIQDPGRPCRHIRLAPTLVLRRSCGCGGA